MDNWEDAEDAFHEEELREMDNDVIQELFERTKAAKEQLDNYKNALFFTMFAAIYCAVLYLQADASTSYQVTQGLQVLLPPGFDESQQNSFQGADEFYAWLNNSVVQTAWQDPYCGDGVCDRPLEFPAFGNFGCQVDCGTFPNTTTVNVIMQTNFESQEAMQASSWNLCLVDPVNACWYDQDQTFTQLQGNFIRHLDIVDGDWVVKINSPQGGVSGSVVVPPVKGAAENNSNDQSPQAAVTWGTCVPKEQSEIYRCRLTCARVLGCLNKICHNENPNSTFVSEVDKAGGFVDCNQICNTDPQQVLRAAEKKKCSELTELDIEAFYGETICFKTDSSQDLFPHDGTPPPPAPPPAPMGANSKFAVPPEGMPGVTARRKIWVALGSADDQRIYNIRVAVNRHLNTAIKDPCLADKATFTSVYRDIFTAFLCTLFGGPADLQGCAYKQGSVEYNSMETLWKHVYDRHHQTERNISAQHMTMFVNELVSAVQSVVTLNEEYVTVLENLFHTFDTAVVTPSAPGCRAGEGPVLMWRPGMQHNTTIHVGDRVTWVWADDAPNAIIGTSKTPKNFFQGFGSGRMVVSRLTLCGEGMIGQADHYAEPVPCKLNILHGSDAPYFTYTKIFNEPGEYRYAGGPFGEPASGQVIVLDAKQTSKASSDDPLSHECAPGCPYSLLANGQCNVECNVPGCTFDGGDCSCVQPGVDFPLCTCPAGQSRDSDGACCESSAMGTGLIFSFSLRSYGPNLTRSLSVLSLSNVPISRHVSDKNELLVGMLVAQQRTGSVNCSGLFGKFTTCTGPEVDKSFGVNPHYLPSSPLYDEAAAADIFNTYNQSELFEGRLPYGFIWREGYEEIGHGFSVVFDINLNNKAATNRLQYLSDGSFLDNGTKSIKVDLMTYNADYQMFGLTEVAVQVNEGGIYYATADTHAVPTAYYSWNANDIARFVLEIIFLCCVAWNILEEVMEVIRLKFDTGSVMSYFKNGWNWLDITSIAIQLAGVGMWIYLCSLSEATKTIQPRYNVYTSLLEIEYYWDTPEPPEGLIAASDAYATLENWVFMHHVYFTLQGINVFLVTLRLLKLLDFQPYLGIITRSIGRAIPNLLHFFLVWIIVMMCFTLFAFMVFGENMEAFSSIKRSFLTCFLIMLNDNTVTYNFVYMEGWEFVAALVWWFAFTCVIIFVLLNFLIAIVVEAFMEVKEGGSGSTTILQDIKTMIYNTSGRWFGPYWRYDVLMKHLFSLGASDFQKAEANSMRRHSFARALKKFDFRKVFEHKEMFRNKDSTKLVLKVGGDQCLDPNSLENIMHRAYDRNVAEREPSASASGRLHSLARMTFRRQRPQQEQLEKLSSTLMRMFGEEVEADKLKAPPHQHHTAAQPKKGQELLEIRRVLETMQTDTDEALEAIHDETAASLEALQQSVLMLARQIQRLSDHAGVPHEKRVVSHGEPSVHHEQETGELVEVREAAHPQQGTFEEE